MDWFRWWHGSVTDPKFQLIARKTNVNVATVIAIWASLLEYASSVTQCNATKHRGDITGFHCDSNDVLLGLDEGTTSLVLEQFIAIGLVSDGRIANWDKRQPKREDNSTERVRKYREKQAEKKNYSTDVTHSNAAKRSETQCNAPEEIRLDKIREEINTPPIVPPTGDGVGNPENSNLEKPDPIEIELFGDGGLWNLWLSSRRGTKDEVRKAYRTVRRAGNVAAIRAGVEEYMRSAYVTSRIEVSETSTIKTLPAWLRAKRWEEIGTGAWDEPCFTWKERHKGTQRVNGSNYVGPCQAANRAPRDGTLG